MAIQPHHGGQVLLAASSPFYFQSPSTTLQSSRVSPSPHLSTCKALDEPQITVQAEPVALNDASISIDVEKLDLSRQSVERERHRSCGPGDIAEKKLESLDCAHDLSGYNSMKVAKVKAGIGVLSTLIAYVSLNSLYKALNPSAFIWQDEDREESSWTATSHSWLDRKACRWLGLCGTAHFRKVRSRFGTHVEHNDQSLWVDEIPEHQQHPWLEGKPRPEDWTADERRLREIPRYVLEYAPLVHLYSGEQFWPCDIAEHLSHITPELNYTPVQPGWQHPNLTDLDALNQWERGRNVFLTSNDDVEERPEWLEGEKNIPDVPPPNPASEEGEAWAEWDGRVDGEMPDDLNGDIEEWSDTGEDTSRDHGGGPEDPDGPTYVPVKTMEGEDFAIPDEPGEHGMAEELKLRRSRSRAQKRAAGGRSDAPAVLIVVDKGHGTVDAFWFYFYSFNLGNVVFNVRFGNHVGDWEHSMVRFHHGQPKAIYFSEHSFGDAYRYEAVEKIGKRPVIYSATGTHAMYATPGTHAYILPWGLLHDETDRGPLWDPILNSHSYTYDYVNDHLRASNFTPHAPTEWFYFNGHWGDKFYPLSDSRQYRFAGQYHYVNGPLGPRFKDLGRRKVCAGSANNPCTIQNWIGGSKRLRRWRGSGEGEELSEDDFSKHFTNSTTYQMA